MAFIFIRNSHPLGQHQKKQNLLAILKYANYEKLSAINFSQPSRQLAAKA